MNPTEAAIEILKDAANQIHNNSMEEWNAYWKLNRSINVLKEFKDNKQFAWRELPNRS